MIFGSQLRFGLIGPAKTTIVTTVVFLLCAMFTLSVDAQKRFSRSYPTGSSVKLVLYNRTGTVEVIGWDRSEISISAAMEEPTATIVPRNLSGVIQIDLVRDNQGREVGIVNFKIRVPYDAVVDIETRIGNLSVTNVRGQYVNAHISSEGDIVLTNIEAMNVAADNVMGDIFYDGLIRDGGRYRFQSASGTITLRIPFNSNFTLSATAPSTRSINLGRFNDGKMTSVGDGRRIIGARGSGSAALIITNQRGAIGFIGR